jgi:hypothetical protein
MEFTCVSAQLSAKERRIRGGADGLQSKEGMPDTSRRNHSATDDERQETLRMHKVDPSALAKLFDEWMQGDEVEQRETFEMLRHSLDEDRPAGYKIFSEA